jgi:chromosome segregation ATPase
MCKKLGVTGLVIVAALVSLWKLGWLPYIHQEVAGWKQQADDAIPPEKKIAVLENEVRDLGPEINKQSGVIAKESVAIDKLTKEVSVARTNLKERENYLADVRAAIKNDKEFTSLSGDKVSKDKLEDHFTRKFNEYKTIKQSVEARAELLEQRKQRLAAAEQTLETMRSKRTEMAAKVETLKIELAKLREKQLQNNVTVDDSQFARVQKLFDEVDTQIATQKKQLEMEKAIDVDAAIQQKVEKTSQTKKAIEEYDEVFSTKVVSDKK